jgi:ATP/maltotriose-dependent transcriptional regulator MalT
MLKALVQLSRVSAFQVDQTAMKAFLAEAVSLIETLPDSGVKADAYTDMTITMADPNTGYSPPETARYLAESERIHRTLNNQTGLAFALIHQANRALFEGDHSLAASQLDEAECLVKELGDDRLLTRLAMIRVLLDLHQGDFASARHHGEIVLQQALNRGDHHVPSTLPIVAVILHGQGLDVWSARVFGLAETLRGTGPKRLVILDQRLRRRYSRRSSRQIGQAAFASELRHQKRSGGSAGIRHSASPNLQLPPQRIPDARELEVLGLLAQDLSNPQIAGRLVVSRRTVDAHLRSIYDKLGVKSRAAAIRVAGEKLLI